MGSKPTIKDIAQLAGVSKTTVSRVLNQKPDVDPATRERILQIIAEQRFVPSVTAAGLAGGRSRVIGVLVPSLVWPFMPEIVQGVAEVVEQSAYEMVLYSLSPQTDRGAALERILDIRLIAGLVAVLPGQLAGRLEDLHLNGFPVVTLDDQGQPTSAPWVGADNRAGAYRAVRYLLDLGYRHIAHIKGPVDYQCSQDRYQGYCQALSEAGLALDPALVFQGDFEEQRGRAGAQALFALTERPDAIFAANDHTAWGVLEEALAVGLRVPGDVALVGFDDMPPSAHKRPPLTTVMQPFQAMGQRAAGLLLRLLEAPRHPAASTSLPTFLKSPLLASAPGGTEAGGTKDKPIRIVLETKLVIRASCGEQRVASVM